MKRQWVFVTGGSRGIGRGIVEHLAQTPYHVCFTYQKATQEAQSVEAAVRTQGGSVEAHQCDGRAAEQIATLAQQLCATHGPPSAIIHNAGITRDGLLMNMSTSDWQDVLSTNLDAAFYVARAFLPALLAERAGSITFLSSVSAIKGNVGQTNYSASKAGLLGLTRSLAAETARFRVRVNAVLPGLIETDMLAQLAPAERQALAKGIPMRRLGNVEEVAGLIKYLISDQASYITGQQLVIDGGFTS